MENIIHKKSFDLSMAQQGHPLITRAGQPAKFIAYVPENDEYYQVIFVCDGRPEGCNKDGIYARFDEPSSNDLFLAPIGYCQGLPVWPGDKLVDHNGDNLIAQDQHHNFEILKWPSKAPVVETGMTKIELSWIYSECDDPHDSTLLYLANKAIERAIADGDCIPTGCVLSLLNKAVNNVEEISTTKTLLVEKVLKDYLEGLK